ncbi:MULTISPECIES: hypothetical protein [unclassified Janthinobacterium]|uniref:hypothetical protein n=1 Tax=unclassified Janthinobacterium TaxID=2610881 RepID=UPI0016154AC1|nr:MULTISPECIES: hypothetical protein [unclassified Janthinobacterium]MBB5609283.1 hypothetical protein [Janthinobacterium sp. S3T4]MBB5614456.1 hypothetical protein [Janthinobacterium sp. S3M3]
MPDMHASLAFIRWPGKPEKLTTVAKFVHIWQQDGQQWRVSRIISYAHSVPN